MQIARKLRAKISIPCRGDVWDEAKDICYRMDRKDLKESYLEHIPQLGI